MAQLARRGPPPPPGGNAPPTRGTAGGRRAGRLRHWAGWLLAWWTPTPGRPAWGRGLRLATAMIVPLTAGIIAGRPTAGLLVGVGAFVVASTDTGGPYRPRAVTMTAATLGVTAAYFLGAVTASPRWLSVLLFVAVLIGSALTGAGGPGIALVATMITIAFIIGAFLPSSLAADAGAALALLAGGGWALGLSLAGWSFDPQRPERRAVRAAIDACAAFLGALCPGEPAAAPAGPPAREPARPSPAAAPGPPAREAARQSLAAARQVLQAALPRGRLTPETRRLWALLYATGILFDAIVAAGRPLRAAAQPGRPAGPAGLAPAVTALQAAVAGAAAAAGAGRARARASLLARLAPLGAAATAQLEGAGGHPGPGTAAAAERDRATGQAGPDPAAAAERDRATGQAGPGPAAAAPEAALTMLSRVGDAVRALIAVVAGPAPGRARVPAGGARRRAVIRAVSQPGPAVLRGAARQAVAGGIALAVAGAFDPAHGAWLVSSTVLVLKPNVGGTLSTAAQRAAATVLGAVIAAGIVGITSDQAALIALSFAAAALAMAVMPLCYSLGMLIITPLSILLTAVLTGSGWLVAVSRTENILIGVAIAVAVSYLLFPAWLRTSVPGLVSATIEALGRYLALVRQPGRPPDAPDGPLHRARSGAEASVAALRAAAGQLGLEPGSRALAAVGDASVAAARVLDAIITLRQELDRAGPGGGEPSPRAPRVPAARPGELAVAELADAVAGLDRALERLPAAAGPAPGRARLAGWPTLVSENAELADRTNRRPALIRGEQP